MKEIQVTAKKLWSAVARGDIDMSPEAWEYLLEHDAEDMVTVCFKFKGERV